MLIKFLNSLKAMLSGSDDISCTRVITFLTALVVLGIYMVHNIAAIALSFLTHFRNKECDQVSLTMVDFSTNAVMVLLIALGAKVAQHYSEQHPGQPTIPDSVQDPMQSSDDPNKQV